VVVVGIARFVRNGVPPAQAAIDATKRMLSRLGCGDALIAFLPLLFHPAQTDVYRWPWSSRSPAGRHDHAVPRQSPAEAHEHGNVVFARPGSSSSYRRILNRAISSPGHGRRRRGRLRRSLYRSNWLQLFQEPICAILDHDQAPGA
jgi:hypothetical protein